MILASFEFFFAFFFAFFASLPSNAKHFQTEYVTHSVAYIPHTEIHISSALKSFFFFSSFKFLITSAFVAVVVVVVRSLCALSTAYLFNLIERRPIDFANAPRRTHLSINY